MAENGDGHPRSHDDELGGAVSVQVVPGGIADHPDSLELRGEVGRSILEPPVSVVDQQVASRRFRISSRNDVSAHEQIGRAVPVEVGRRHGARARAHRRQGLLLRGETAVAVVEVEAILEVGVIRCEGAVPTGGNVEIRQTVVVRV